MKIMLGKALVFAVIILFIGAGFVPSISGINSAYKSNIRINKNIVDELDQFQIYHNHWAHCVLTTLDGFRQSVAQIFQPSLNILTRVELWFKTTGITEETIKLSIKKDNIFNKELTSITLDLISIYEGDQGWIEFDFPDIYVEPNQKYLIFCESFGLPKTIDNSYAWRHYKGNVDDPGPYIHGHSIMLYNGQIVDEWFYDDCCFKTYGYNDSNASSDLAGIGNLNWMDINPSQELNATIQIWNNGFPGSCLDWKIDSYPDWGTWEFSSESGEDLTPADGVKIIEVTVSAPDEKNANFTGEIKVINTNNPDDFEIIPITLSTPKNKPYLNSPFLRFLEQHQHMFPLLRQLLSCIIYEEG